MSEPETPCFCRKFCGISGDLTPSTQKSLAIAIVRFWCAKAKCLVKIHTPNLGPKLKGYKKNTKTSAFREGSPPELRGWGTKSIVNQAILAEDSPARLLGGRFGYFFLLGGGEGESKAPVGFFLNWKSPRGGGFPEEGGAEGGEGPGGCLLGIWGGD